jgi:hypothetical protein
LQEKKKKEGVPKKPNQNQSMNGGSGGSNLEYLANQL